MIKKICELYETNEDDLIDELVEKKIIRASHKFLDRGFDFIKENYTRIFEGVNSNKVRKATDQKKKITIRTSKYDELKDLWEKLNEKVVLEYKFDNEAAFQKLFIDYLTNQKNNLNVEGIREKISEIEIKENIAAVRESEAIYHRKTSSISTMKCGRKRLTDL